MVLSPNHTIESPRELWKQTLISSLLPRNSVVNDLRWDPDSGIPKSFVSDPNAQPGLRTTKFRNRKLRSYISFNYFSLHWANLYSTLVETKFIRYLKTI